MKSNSLVFDEHNTLEALAHYLPSQSPLKDFVHHNTLHGFQELSFDKALATANKLFGYKVYTDLSEFRNLYSEGKISEAVLNRSINSKKGADQLLLWKHKLVDQEYDTSTTARVGQLREKWKSEYKINLDKLVHPALFRIVGSYLDQGISIWHFPSYEGGFLESIRAIDQNSDRGIFTTKRAKQLLADKETSLRKLLEILVGDEKWFEQYLFDQQFAHPGWSGMVSVLEHQPNTLLDPRKISLHDFIILECLFEIDALDKKFYQTWRPLGLALNADVTPLFDPVSISELFEVQAIWQEAREWSYFDQVLAGTSAFYAKNSDNNEVSFQALFCIDDRCCSIRRYFEMLDPHCATYGTPGHFNIESYFQPEDGKFYTKVCPAPLSPKHLIVESDSNSKKKRDNHFARQTHGLIGGWLISQTLGFWSAIRLAINIFIPSKSPAMVSSYAHMDPNGKLSIESSQPPQYIDNLKVGFSEEEMANSVEGMLRSIGLIENFAPIIYTIGHGASSVNNTHYAGYDCGACSGRPGSVNARAIAFMGNHKGVRKVLASRGINIPDSTQFVGGLFDTTRDQISCYDLEILSSENSQKHIANYKIMKSALSLNAKERARRFVIMDNGGKAEKVHSKVKMRSVSLFEPRPELNHATNCLCIVGTREISENLFLDRRAFLNSYDPIKDPNGDYLLGILRAVAPVCGGINLEYFFSRNDNSKLGAGTKLPHNVMGLIGVANGMDGDLRTGLPAQMTEVHDALRLLVIVEQRPEVVLNTIKRDNATFEWFANEWVLLATVDPLSKKISVFKKDHFEIHEPLCPPLPTVSDIEGLIESSHNNLPVYKIASL